jgi:outer membrane protein assembly factor BamB
VKYSASGGLLDGVTFNGTSSTIVSSMTLSADGSVLAGGFYSGTLFLSQFAAPAAGSGDAFLLKLDPSDGDLLWSRKHGGVNGDTFNGLSTAGCGDVFVVGAYRSAVDFGGGALPYSGSSSTITNGVLAKYRP